MTALRCGKEPIGPDHTD